MRTSSDLQVWEIVLPTNVGSLNSLSWDSHAAPDDGRSLVLEDRVAEQTIDMSARNSYVIPEPKWVPEGRLRIYLGSAPLLEEHWESEAASRPTDFALEQNHPNPFNAGTVISYTIPSADRVRLEVFDVLGRRVATLVDNIQLAGRYSYPWRGTDRSGIDLPSGLYIARLQAGEQTAVRKLMLLK